MTLLFIAALGWSAKSAQPLGANNALTFGTTVTVQSPLAFGGRPNVAYVRGFDFGLEISAGMRGDIMLIRTLDVGVLVVGIKQVVLQHEGHALALRAEWTPFLFQWVGTQANGEAMYSAPVSQRWFFDAGLGVRANAYWGRTLHHIAPEARFGFAYNKERFTTAFGLEGAVQTNFAGFMQPAPFPYVLVRSVEVSAYLSFAYR